jgi:prolipoprotein diacylglyceryltransferase
MLLLYKRLKRHFLETYAFSYGVFRFLMEFARGDNRGATGLVLQPSQIMSLLLILGGVVVLLCQKGILFKRLRRKMDGYTEQRRQAVKMVVHKS